MLATWGLLDLSIHSCSTGVGIYINIALAKNGGERVRKVLRILSNHSQHFLVSTVSRAVAAEPGTNGYVVEEGVG